MVETHVVDVAGLQALIDGLVRDGYTVIGPTVRSGAVVNAPIHGVEDLPRGWGDDQMPAGYRLRQRDDEALFGYVVGAHSPKTVFFPSDELLWRGRRTPDGRRVEPSAGPGDEEPAEPPRYALLGVRSCDLVAVGIHDTVLNRRAWADVHYAARRTDAVVIAVACSDPSGSCFCVSMGTGPRPQPGRGAPFDLSLTELLDGEHRFLVEVGTDRGAALLADVRSRPATGSDLAAAHLVTEQAADRMGRRLDTEGVRELLYDAVDSPHWADVASRCLSCTNCTLVCPTCFCTGVEEVTDLTGDEVERHRVWDSCFTTEFSYIHGGSVRESPASRYRQWITHKLAAWQDQFGSSGCVGCGRCITWCPAAIDITAEVAALQGAPGSNLPPEAAAVATAGGN